MIFRDKYVSTKTANDITDMKVFKGGLRFLGVFG
jgi:hypothetical protein